MKQFIAVYIGIILCFVARAQNSKQSYPEPEFLKEIYAFNRENNSLVRLQKETSQLDTKSKLGGFGGAAYVYTIDGERSKVRFSSAHLPSFVFRSREDHSSNDSNKDNADMNMGNDSMAKMMEGMESVSSMVDDMMDPSKMITLYSMEQKKGERIVTLQASAGAFSKNKKANNKYSLSFRKVKDGYYEIVVDKILPKGEYGFVNAALGSMEATLFVFGVD